MAYSRANFELPKSNEGVKFKDPKRNETERSMELSEHGLHISHIPLEMTETLFFDLFSKCGRIVKINLKPIMEGRFYRIGKIRYSTAEECLEAMKIYHLTHPHFMSVTVDRNIPSLPCQRKQISNDVSSNGISDHDLVSERSLPMSSRGDARNGNLNCNSFGPQKLSEELIRSNQHSRASFYSQQVVVNQHTTRSLTEGISENSFGQKLSEELIRSSQHSRASNCSQQKATNQHTTRSLTEGISELSLTEVQSKVKFSEIKQTISFDAFTIVNVAFINTPHSFYLRYSDSRNFGETLDILCLQEAEIGNVKVGDTVAVKSRKCGQWFRSKVNKVNSDGTYQVKFIDYGNEELVNLSDIRMLPAACIKYPAQAFHCRLANVVPQNRLWTNEVITAFKKFTENKMLKAKGVEINDKYFVCLCSKEGNDIGSMLSFATDARVSFPIHEGSVESWEENSKISAFISLRDAPGHFWVVDNSNDISTKVLLRLNELCSQPSRFDLSDVKVGSVVAARENSKERFWYRGVILEVADNEWLVQDLDFGKCEKANEIRPLPIECECYPSLAISLTALRLLDRERDSDLQHNSDVTLRVKLCSDIVHIVDITDGDSHLYSASSIWFENNARKEKSPSNVISLSLKNGNDTKRNTSHFTPTIEQSCNVSKAEVASLKSVSLLNRYQCQSIAKDTHFKLPTQQFLLLKKEYPVSPAWYSKEDGLVLQVLTRENEQILKRLEDHLGEACEKMMKPGCDIKPSVSQILSYRMNKHEWYRCKVVKIISSTSVDVRLVDHGNRCTTNVKDLIELPREFWDFHPVAVAVTLSDIEPDIYDRAMDIFENNQEISWKMRVVNFKKHPIEVIMLTSENKMLREMVLKSISPEKDQESTTSENHIVTIENSLRNHESKLENHTEVKPVLEEISLEPSFLYSEAAIQWLPVGETVKVMILNVITPLIMYCWSGNFNTLSEQLDELTNLMTKTIRKETSENGPNSYRPKVDEICLAEFNNEWYRATCLKVEADGCNVLYVDYGNIRTVPFTSVRRMHPDYMKDALQAISCCIDGIPDGRHFEADECEKLKKIIPLAKEIEVIVVSCDEKSSCYSIIIPGIRKEDFLSNT